MQGLTEHLAYSQHLLHDPSIEQNDDGFFLRKYPPMSPRNRIMYLLSNGKEGLHATLKRCLEIPQEQNLIDDTTEQPIEEPVKKRRRKQSSQTVSVTARSVFEHLGCQSTAELNSSNKNRTLYNRFKEQLLTEGNIIWRYHDDLEDICAMTDYNSTTGLLLPVICTCNCYQT